LSVTVSVDNGTCSATPNGTVVLTVNNGAGPYIVFIDGVNNGGFTIKTGLNIGSHSWSVTDVTNRTASGSFNINPSPNLSINLNIVASYNTSNDSVIENNPSYPTGTRIINRIYNVTIDAPNIPVGTSIQGYFVVTYKQLALYKTTGIVLPDYTYDSLVYQPNVSWSLIEYSGSLSGYRWRKDSVIIPTANAYANETVEHSLANRKCPTTPTPCNFVQVSSNIMPSSQNNSCPSSINQAGVAKLSYTVGTESNPITIENDTDITGFLPTSFAWRPNSSGLDGTFTPQTSCPRAYAEDWEIYFVSVGNLPQCTELLFNGSPYNSSNPSLTKYRRSFAVVDNQASTLNIPSIQYGNGTPWSSITPDNIQRVLSY
jgi:hypothetical protein